MLTKIIALLVNAARGRGNRRSITYGIILITLSLPVIAVSIYHVIAVDSGLRASALNEQKHFAVSTAAALNDRLEYISSFISIYSTHPKIRRLASEKKWDEAIEYLKYFRPLETEQFISGLFFSDSEGNLTSITPPAPEAIGKNFSYRDWYKGVQSTGYLYLSEVYQRANEPKYNVVAIAAPILGEDGLLIGIVGFQIRLEYFAEWSKKINTSNFGFISIIDRYGHIISHPKYAPQGSIMDFSSLFVVKNLQKGNGVEVLFNPIEKTKQAIAYAPITHYGLTVLVEQDATIAFRTGTNSRLAHALSLGLLLLWDIFLIYLLIKTIEFFQGQRRDGAP